MKLKLTKAEMQALEAWLSIVVSSGTPNGLRNKLLVAIMIKFYEKVAKSLVSTKKNYTMKLDDATCIAFVLLFLPAHFNPVHFADNLMLKLINQFQQHYA